MSALDLLDLIGTAVFSVTGALVARERRLDLFGVIVLGTVTAVGGGTLRDVLLGRTPVFWVHDTVYLYVAAGAAVFTFFTANRNLLSRRFLLIADAVGLALFTVIGAQIALEQATPPLVAIIMGAMTGVAGGVIRDLLAGKIPLILQREIYATASLGGAAVYVLWAQFTTPTLLTTLISMGITTVLRLVSIRLGGQLPQFIPAQSSDRP